jgi:hypothetical protein
MGVHGQPIALGEEQVRRASGSTWAASVGVVILVGFILVAVASGGNQAAPTATASAAPTATPSAQAGTYHSAAWGISFHYNPSEYGVLDDQAQWKKNAADIFAGHDFVLGVEPYLSPGQSLSSHGCLLVYVDRMNRYRMVKNLTPSRAAAYAAGMYGTMSYVQHGWQGIDRPPGRQGRRLGRHSACSSATLQAPACPHRLLHRDPEVRLHPRVSMPRRFIGCGKQMAQRLRCARRHVYLRCVSVEYDAHRDGVTNSNHGEHGVRRAELGILVPLPCVRVHDSQRPGAVQDKRRPGRA